MSNHWKPRIRAALGLLRCFWKMQAKLVRHQSCRQACKIRTCYHRFPCGGGKIRSRWPNLTKWGQFPWGQKVTNPRSFRHQQGHCLTRVSPACLHKLENVAAEHSRIRPACPVYCRRRLSTSARPSMLWHSVPSSWRPCCLRSLGQRYFPLQRRTPPTQTLSWQHWETELASLLRVRFA